MKLYFKQTPNSLGRLFGRGLAHGKEYDVTNEARQLLYAIHIDYEGLYIHDTEGRLIATVKAEALSASRCIIRTGNRMKDVFEWVKNQGYMWSNAGYIIKHTGNWHYDVVRENTCVMRVVRKSRFRFICDNADYQLDVPDTRYLFDGVIITTAIALLNYHRANFFPLFTLLFSEK